MQKYFDINEEGFSIRCKLYYNKDIHNLPNMVIATYGFGGNKDNKAVEKFADRITSKYHGYGVICFDWPNHGNDARNKLIMDECITYLHLVTEYAKKEFGAQKVFNYSSSFGAYITLRDLMEKGENPFTKIAFRCPAIKMFQTFDQGITDEERTKLSKGKEIIRGFERKIKITQDILDDMRDHDVSGADFMDYADDILMIHGTKDEMAKFEDTAEFCDNNVIELIPVENADHPFSNPNFMDFAIQAIITFFKPEEA